MSWALLAAVGGGWLMSLAYPDPGWWPLLVPGLGLVLWALRGRGVGGGLLVGAVSGFAYYGFLIEWLTVYLGLVPWLALTLAQVFFTALGGALIAQAWRWVPRAWPGPAGRLVLTPVVVAGAWMTREAVSSVFPFGGFAWGRLAHSQAEGPLAPLVAWTGFSALSFLIAALVAVTVAAIGATDLARLHRASVPVGLAAALLVWPAFPIATTGTMTVAAVQGNSNSGLFADYQRGEILQDHYDATQPLFGRDDIDLLVWPENASDLDPLRDDYASQVMDIVSREVGAPLAVGTITASGDETFNSQLLWRAGEGAVDQYDKIRPVPFAEYLPMRDFFTPLAPDLFALVPRDYSFGQRDTVFDIDGVIAGIAICWDIVSDDLFFQTIDDDAEILISPTNNADFGVSDQSVQQLAIARLRAIEAGRTLVNASTVGASAIVAPDGSTITDLPLFTAGTMVADVPLSDTVTPAHYFGRFLEWLVIIFTVTTIGAARVLGRGTAKGKR
ncbi:apolipoprotein N-acyltransferase [Microcella putealis]|uniref:Apolipoprotein N-acyltransferase n=1 Tax=Microcella putealis TaxID=337005 RepID=A0A4Q7LWG7_9MICO|nr:apolipoprotein N-acyltransferase [Microcella putealis]RZS58913.1 apolipoprotein N-acyltransferase [Microcella putealis]TQM23939.1 apolipoprotein N-acyltransferase [Microcella putealis]